MKEKEQIDIVKERKKERKRERERGREGGRKEKEEGMTKYRQENIYLLKV